MEDDRGGWLDFVTWYQEEHGRLSTAMVGLSGDVGLASEVTDEAFARAWLHWERVQVMDRPTGWVYRTAVHELRRRHRRRVLERRVSEAQLGPAAVFDPSPVFELWRLVATLSARQRVAVVLRYVGDLDEEDVAKVMGVKRSTVSSTLTAARRKLGETLEGGRSNWEVDHE